jgi:U3 small nucleolar ribonucleoprotein protein IMP4
MHLCLSCPYENNVSLLICDQVTRHDIKDKSVLGTMSEAYPHLILNNFSTKVLTSACCILKNHVFFFVPYPWKIHNLLTFRQQSVLYDSLDVEHASVWCSSVLPDWELTMVWVFVCGGFQQLGQRTANILKHLFPVPKSDSKRIITFANESDYISFRCVTFVTSFWRTPGFRV